MTRPLRLLLASWLLCACGDDPPAFTAAREPDLAADSLDGARVTATVAAIVADPLTTTMSAEQAATTAAMRAGALLLPAGCVTATAQGATATYVFTNCSGPYGLLRLSGTLRATITPNGPGQGFTVALVGALTANGGSWNVDATGNATSTSGDRSVALTTRSSGTGPRGLSFAQAGVYTARWSSDCLDLNGTWTTRVEALTFNTTVAALRRCRGQCPAAGGTVTLGTSDGRTVTLTFTGEAAARVSGSGGRMGTVVLPCGA